MRHVGVGISVCLYSGLGWLSGMREALMAVFESRRRRNPTSSSARSRDLACLATRPGADHQCRDSGVATDSPTPSSTGSGSAPGAPVGPERARRGPRVAGQHGAVLRALQAAGRPPHADPVPVVGRTARRSRLRAAQAALDLSDGDHQGAARLPGVRHRADPGRVDQLLLPGRHVAAAWAHTSVAARVQRERDQWQANAVVEGPKIDVARLAPAPAAAGASSASSTRGAFAAGAGVMLALVAVLRRKKK